MENNEINDERKDRNHFNDAIEESSNSDTTEKTNSKQRRKDKYSLSSQFKKKLENYPEILVFISMLQKCIEKQKQKLKKMKKKRIKTNCKSTQTELEAKDGKSVTEEITEAAQQTLQQNGFVYEETSGLYYDYNSGYYYNAEYGLYYDGNTGTYLKYNQDTKEYNFHSQTDVRTEKYDSQADEKHYRKSSKKNWKTKRDELHVNKHYNSNLDEMMRSFDALKLSSTLALRHHDEENVDLSDATERKKLKIEAELEDGECSDLSASTYSSDEWESDIDIAKQYPPCMRIIIEETAIPTIKQGSLHLITFEGGTIGREGPHVLLLPEINISKHHAKISFNHEKNCYFITDVGSRNGTLLNGNRLASAKCESEPFEIKHGCRIQIGSTIFLCHVHNGNQTCGHCEPGLIQHMQCAQTKEEVQIKELDRKTAKSMEHKQQLKQLRKRFGLSLNDQGKTNPGAGYIDRAQNRRVTVGSQNPHEKTQTASLTESIASSNKGFKLLSKMGWKEGQALGRDNQGRLEPVELVSNPGTSGMGSTGDNKVIQPSMMTQPPSQSKYMKTNVLSKTKDRYNQACFNLTDI